MIGLKGWKTSKATVIICAILLGGLPIRATADECIRILPLGDSITRGYFGSAERNGYRKPLHTLLVNRGYDVDFVGEQRDGNFSDPNHEGYDGKTAAWLNPGMAGRLTTSRPDIVLYHIGTNNLSGNDIATYAQDANETLNIIYDFDPNITVVLAKIILTRDDAARNTRTHNYNLLLEGVAQHWANAGYSIELVNMENALNYPADMADNLHPNDSGYSKMANAWFAELDDLLSTAPAIVSTPVINAIVLQDYRYDVNAEGYPGPVYTLTTSPSEMTIDSNSGVIEWTPTAIGNFDVTVKAGNGKSPDAYQSFTVSVSTMIKFDAASSGSRDSAGSTLSWQHTIGGDGGRILVVGVVGKDSNPADLAISSVTYNGAAMIPVSGSGITASGQGCYVKAELYYLLEANLPSSGSHTVTVTYQNGVDKIIAGAVSLANTDQHSPEAVAVNSNTGTAISTDITPLTNGAWVVDIAGSSNYGILSTNAEDMMLRWSEATGSSAAAGGTRMLMSAQQTTMGWSCTSAGTIVHSLAAISPTKCLISGDVLDGKGEPVEGASVSAGAGGQSDTSDANGHYRITVLPGWSGTVTAAKTQHSFKPAERAYNNVTASQPGQNYVDISEYDLNADGLVDWSDVSIMHAYWLQSGPGIEGDFNGDGVVNALDLAELALVW
jgi:lysophospholipase L1-like esterase